MTRNLELKSIKKDQFKQACTVMVIGFFDGVHMGHQRILNICNARSREEKGLSAALTFDKPPLNILKKQMYKKLILPYKEKIRIMESLGIDIIVTAEIGMEFLNLSPEEFCDDILIGLFNIKELFIGKGFRFGRGGCGDVGFLKKYLGARRIKVNEVSLIESRGEVVSSTVIRRYYLEGDIKRVKELLGRDPYIIGKVIRGAGRGRKLGYPTANIDVCDSLFVPGDGVYFGKISIGKKNAGEIPALINIGDNPTFGGSKKWVESHMLDFNGNIYGEDIRITFLKKLRKEIRFKNGEGLIEQIKKDIADARIFFKKNTKNSNETFLIH